MNDDLQITITKMTSYNFNLLFFYERFITYQMYLKMMIYHASNIPQTAPRSHLVKMFLYIINGHFFVTK